MAIVDRFGAEIAVCVIAAVGAGSDCCEVGGGCAPPRVITVINCFWTSFQLICVLDNTLLHKSILFFVYYSLDCGLNLIYYY